MSTSPIEHWPALAESVTVNDDTLIVDLVDGRSIAVPLAWYPRLLRATQAQRENWRRCAAGYGIHWPDIDEHLSTEGLLRGSPSPEVKKTEPDGARAEVNSG